MLYLASLAATIVVETAVALAALPRYRQRLWIDVPLASLLTHPLATLAVHDLGLPLLAVEAGVTAVEALVFLLVTGLDVRRALLLSFVANGTTTAIALAWRAL